MYNVDFLNCFFFVRRVAVNIIVVFTITLGEVRER